MHGFARTIFFSIIFLPIMSIQINPAAAQDLKSLKSGKSWTEIGAYGFMTDVSGDVKSSNVTAPVDVSFSDILENLEMGFMGFAEHRNGKWSLIGDVFYADIKVEQSLAVTSTASVRVDVKQKQLMTEGFVGYRVAEQVQDGNQFGLDILVGARYNRIDVEIGLDASQLGLGAASRNPSIDWVDGVIGLRAQFGGNRGWGATAWADFGKGADSSSHQFAGLVNYRFDNNVNLFGGYRLYNFKYETGSGTRFVELDLDYKGPMLGISYRF